MRFIDTPCLNILSYKRTSKSRIEEKLIEFNYLIETSRSSSKRRTNRVVATIINRPLSLSLSVENRATRFPRPCEKKERKDSSPSFSAGDSSKSPRIKTNKTHSMLSLARGSADGFVTRFVSRERKKWPGEIRNEQRAKIQQKSIDEEARLILEILGKIRKSSIISEVITIGGDGKVGIRARKRVAFIRVSLRTNCCSFPRGAHASTSRRQVVHIMVEAPTPFLSTPTRDGKRGGSHARARRLGLVGIFPRSDHALFSIGTRQRERNVFSIV